MKTYYNILFCLLLMPMLAVAGNGDKWKGKYTKEKKLNKEYTVNSNAGLKVDNSYGNIDIITWTQNKTVIEVTIITNGDNEEKVQERLDDITVEFSGNGSLVSATTKFGKGKSSWNNWWGNNSKNVSMEVNYIIKMPVTNTVNLDNDYGSITLDRLEGNAKINCDYGQLIIGELMDDDNYLNFDYTKKSTIRYMKSGRIVADYSEFTLDKVEDIEINTDYTKTEVKEAQSVNYNSDYGSVTIGKANGVVGNGDYVTVRLGEMSGDVNLKSDYGSIKIERLTSKAKDVTIDSNYTGVDIGLANGYNFDFDLDLRYGGFSGKELVDLKHSNSSGSSKQYAGTHGAANSGNELNIRSNYGSITFNRN